MAGDARPFVLACLTLSARRRWVTGLALQQRRDAAEGNPPIGALGSTGLDFQVLLTVPLGCEVLWRNFKLIRQDDGNRLCAPVRKRKVVLIGANRVRMAFDQKDLVGALLKDAHNSVCNRRKPIILVCIDLPGARIEGNRIEIDTRHAITQFEAIANFVKRVTTFNPLYGRSHQCVVDEGRRRAISVNNVTLTRNADERRWKLHEKVLRTTATPDTVVDDYHFTSLVEARTTDQPPICIRHGNDFDPAGASCDRTYFSAAAFYARVTTEATEAVALVAANDYTITLAHDGATTLANDGAAPLSRFAPFAPHLFETTRPVVSPAFAAFILTLLALLLLALAVVLRTGGLSLFLRFLALLLLLLIALSLSLFALLILILLPLSLGLATILWIRLALVPPILLRLFAFRLLLIIAVLLGLFALLFLVLLPFLLRLAAILWIGFALVPPLLLRLLAFPLLLINAFLLGLFPLLILLLLALLLSGRLGWGSFRFSLCRTLAVGRRRALGLGPLLPRRGLLLLRLLTPFRTGLTLACRNFLLRWGGLRSPGWRVLPLTCRTILREHHRLIFACQGRLRASECGKNGAREKPCPEYHRFFSGKVWANLAQENSGAGREVA